ncbi:Integrase [Nostoc flagelliforme CCNUN1]|uniref:Integrase n=1 Tax=Nostoc flagelliforme CCNUN1 TaxID=2038116 RepID=A0A2K8T5H5_9NOSO|nr:tyrosine-type recombinase/integrase [Nostoc flagelliforme]AUB42911.1 Integrase [Nostoc flagelliforme CCNUN1]
MVNHRSKRGTVGIEIKGNKLRLRLPRTIAEVNARYISTGLDDTPENRRLVQVKAWEIEADIQHGRLDTTLERYRFVNQLSSSQVVITRASTTTQDLRQLWLTYSEYRKPVVAITTYKQKYCGYFANHISRLPSFNPLDAETIRHYLVNNFSNDTAKRVLEQLNGCCKWAVASGLLTTNKFEGMANQLSRSWNSEDIDPFTASEREAIINAYRDNHYYNFIRFLFLTGCRPGEACALRWRNVSDTSVLFAETYNATYHLVKETKTGKPRRFPINQQLAEVLTIQRQFTSNGYNPETLVFITHYHRQAINNNTIPTALGWKNIVNTLVKEGKVSHYRPPYNCRHTFITSALEAGLTVPQVAKLVGNTPAVILKHYAGSAVVDVPVFG